MPGCSFSLPFPPCLSSSCLIQGVPRDVCTSSLSVSIGDFDFRISGIRASPVAIFAAAAKVPAPCSFQGKIVRAGVRARIRDDSRCVPVNCDGVEFPRVDYGILATGRSGACVSSPVITSRARDYRRRNCRAQLTRRLLRHW